MCEFDATDDCCCNCAILRRASFAGAPTAFAGTFLPFMTLTSRQNTLPSLKHAPKLRTGNLYWAQTACAHSSRAATCVLSPAASDAASCPLLAGELLLLLLQASKLLPEAADLALTSSISARNADRLMSCKQGTECSTTWVGLFVARRQGFSLIDNWPPWQQLQNFLCCHQPNGCP